MYFNTVTRFDGSKGKHTDLQYECAACVEVCHQVIDGPRLGKVEHGPARENILAPLRTLNFVHHSSADFVDWTTVVCTSFSHSRLNGTNLNTDFAPGSPAALTISPLSHSSARAGLTGYALARRLQRFRH